MLSFLRSLVALAILAALASGCVKHVKPYEEKKRDYRSDLEVVPEPATPSDGAIWTERDQLNRLFADPRASKINDIVVVRIEEISQANNTAQTTLVKDSEISAQIANLMGAIERFQKSNPNFNKDSLISSKYKADFDGGGETKRGGKVIATVPALIRREMPDGNLFIEGHRVVMVNDEEAHFYVSGIIRPHDIDRNNSISSSLIAEAHVEFTGRGVVTEKSEPGWGSRALDYAWPF
ncbi:MAG: flagellar basal body L-ring protein FlgH [Myxococcales bacterium]|nr:MAG: flagellar basal body L-ring protein FlgH [Myxococcales bacterium]